MPLVSEITESTLRLQASEAHPEIKGTKERIEREAWKFVAFLLAALQHPRDQEITGGELQNLFARLVAQDYFYLVIRGSRDRHKQHSGRSRLDPSFSHVVAYCILGQTTGCALLMLSFLNSEQRRLWHITDSSTNSQQPLIVLYKRTPTFLQSKGHTCNTRRLF